MGLISFFIELRKKSKRIDKKRIEKRISISLK